MPLVIPGAQGGPADAEAVGHDGAVLEPDPAGACPECCGGGEPVQLYRRWCPCTYDGCWPDHRDIWVAVVGANDRHPCPPGSGGVVGRHEGWCYVPTAVFRPAAHLPPGAVIATPECLEGGTGCGDARCVPEGDGDCQCGCEEVCWSPDFASGFDPPAACAICCFAPPMTYNFEQRYVAVLARHNPTCCGPGECDRVDSWFRTTQRLPPEHQCAADAIPLGGEFCVGFGVGHVGGGYGCAACYQCERRTVRSSCHDGACGPLPGTDSGWLPAGELAISLSAPMPPSDTGWVDFGIPGVRWGRTRCRYSATCLYITWIDEREIYDATGTGLDGQPCYTVLTETLVSRLFQAGQGGTGNCCAGCRREVCGEVRTGGECPPLPPVIVPPGIEPPEQPSVSGEGGTGSQSSAPSSCCGGGQAASLEPASW